MIFCTFTGHGHHDIWHSHRHHQWARDLKMAQHRALVNAVQRHHSHMEFHFCRFACKCIFQHIQPNLLLGNLTQVNKMLYMYEDQNTRCTARTWRAHFVISSSIHDILNYQIQFTPKSIFRFIIIHSHFPLQYSILILLW